MFIDKEISILEGNLFLCAGVKTKQKTHCGMALCLFADQCNFFRDFVPYQVRRLSKSF